MEETETKAKNQKKVEAGRRSAAARKAKEEAQEKRHVAFEERLAQLEEAKQRMHTEMIKEQTAVDDVDDDGTSRTSYGTSGTSEPVVQSVTAPPVPRKYFHVPWGSDLAPWLIGSLGVVVIVYGVYGQAKQLYVPRVKQQPPRPVQPSPTPAPPQRDPFSVERAII